MPDGAVITAAAAAIAKAIKASGAIVRVDASNFESLLRRTEKPLIIYAEGGVFSTSHQYLMSYRGLTFFAKSSNPILLPSDVEVIVAEKIWIP